MTKETYNKGVDKLLDAYNQGNLIHGNCTACAVGTLLGSNAWGCDFYTANGNELREGAMARKMFFPSYYPKFGFTGQQAFDIMDNGATEEQEQHMRKVLDTLYEHNGFTRDELVKIEGAFERAIAHNRNYLIHDKEKEGQFLGLTAVLKVMEGMVEEEVESRQPQLQEIYDKKMEMA